MGEKRRGQVMRWTDGTRFCVSRGFWLASVCDYRLCLCEDEAFENEFWFVGLWEQDMVICPHAAFIRVARNKGSLDWVVTVLSGRRWSGSI